MKDEGERRKEEGGRRKEEVRQLNWPKVAKRQLTCHAQRAFTFVELIIIILILGIIAINIEFDFPGPTANLRAQAEMLASSIRYTQSMSLTRGERYRINFSSTSYTITDLAGTTTIPHPATNANTTNLEANTTLTVNAAIANSLISFDGKGQPYITSTSPGTALSSTGTITLTKESETVTIDIAAETGRVSL